MTSFLSSSAVHGPFFTPSLSQQGCLPITRLASLGGGIIIAEAQQFFWRAQAPQLMYHTLYSEGVGFGLGKDQPGKREGLLLERGCHCPSFGGKLASHGIWCIWQGSHYLLRMYVCANNLIYLYLIFLYLYFRLMIQILSNIFTQLKLGFKQISIRQNKFFLLIKLSHL